MSGRTISHPNPSRLLLWIYAASAASLLLISNGRFNSGDATAQGDAAIHWVMTGDLGAASLPSSWAQDFGERSLFRHLYRPHGAEDFLWVLAPDGRYYEAHDPGNMLLMAPFAASAIKVARSRSWGSVEESTDFIKRFITIGYAFIYALIGPLLASTLLRVMPARWAVPMSFLFMFGTMFLPLSKSTYDVVPGTVASAGVLCGLAGALDTRRLGVGVGLILGCSLAALVLFRLSAFPFVFVASVGAIVTARPRTLVRGAVAALVPLIMAVGVVLWYNDVRTGSPFHPATTAPQFDRYNALDGSMIDGLIGLTIRPSRGLFAYSPVLLLAVLAPWALRRSEGWIRALCAWLLIGSGMYILLISKMNAYHGIIGWGARYMLPILPLLFLPTALTLRALWPSHRGLLTLLASVSIALNVLPILVNPALVCFAFPGGNRHDSLKPVQHLAAIRGLLLSAQGVAYPDADSRFYLDGMSTVAARAESLVIPNSWVVRLLHDRGTRPLGLGLLGLLSGVLLLSIVGLRRTLRVIEGPPLSGLP